MEMITAEQELAFHFLPSCMVSAVVVPSLAPLASKVPLLPVAQTGFPTRVFEIADLVPTVHHAIPRVS